jgi:site-specific recombinase XerD
VGEGAPIVDVLAPLTPEAELSAELRERVAHYIEHSAAANTRRAMKSDWRRFAGWCDLHGLCAIPATPETVAAYVASAADSGLATTTIGRYLTTISQAHKAAHMDSPTKDFIVKRTLKGVVGELQHKPRRVSALRTSHIKALLSLIPTDTMAGTRDRALLLLGFSGALRRSEIVALNVADVEFVPEGMVVTVRKSKTDQAGEGIAKAIVHGRNPHTCPVRAMQAWLEASGTTQGPIFRGVNKGDHVEKGRLTPQSVALIVKRCVGAAGLGAKDFSGHSMRSGFATEAAAGGASLESLMRQTGHSTVEMALRYIREADQFANNASERLGL